MVVLLAAVGTLMLGALMMRSGGQRLAAQRQTDEYQQHHIQRGLQEALSAWLKTVQRLNLALVIEPGDEVLTFELTGNREISVWLYPDQWKVLGQLGGLTGDELTDAMLMRDTAIQHAPRNDPGRYLRNSGPMALSLHDTPTDIMHAMIEAVSDSATADELVRAVESMRASGELNQAAFSRAAVAANIESDVRPRIQRMFTGKPSLWELRVEVRVPVRAGFEPVVWGRYSGRTTLSTSTRGRSNQEWAFSPIGDFLEWEQIELDDPSWEVVGPSR